ncbi:MAG TPA: helix-turn-helix domain-containing protein [Chloroflexota bacterium]|nr:helix-turn-helix domain-containing protein [Chloroflexota bacterium]
MARTSATQRETLLPTGRPEGGSGETGPSVPRVPGVRARLGVITTLHELIETLTELACENAALPASASSDLPLLLDATEAAKLLSLSRAKVCDMASRGEIPSIRIGRAARIPRDPLLRWIDQRTTVASATSVRLPNWAYVDRSAEL